jgi:Uma2 family endonuclease
MSILQPNVRRPAPSGDVQPHPGRKLTEREFLQWIGPKTRAEWVDGEVEMMAADSIDHADYGWWLLSLVKLFVAHHGLGTAHGSSVLVRLPRQKRMRMPDVIFLGSGSTVRRHPALVEGRPDLIMEVVSPDSVVRDWHDKYREYERAGVREYWVIDRIKHRIESFILGRDDKYRRIEEEDGKIRSAVLKGFFLRVEWLLAPEPPALSRVLRELGVS